MNFLRNAWRAHQRRRYLKWQRRNHVVLPRPVPDERSSIAAFQRIMGAGR